MKTKTIKAKHRTAIKDVYVLHDERTGWNWFVTHGSNKLFATKKDLENYCSLDKIKPISDFRVMSPIYSEAELKKAIEINT